MENKFSITSFSTSGKQSVSKVATFAIREPLTAIILFPQAEKRKTELLLLTTVLHNCCNCGGGK